MKRKTRIILIVIISIFAGIIIAATIYFFMPSASDYGTFLKMRNVHLDSLENIGVNDRFAAKSFEDYSMKLPLLYAYMFKTEVLSLYLKSVSSEKIETATINQLEIGKDTDDYFDFTFMIRARPEYNVPFFHGDALKALPGVTGALYMDFYSFESTLDAEMFFMGETDKLELAMELARPYWKNDGFGELTPHLDPYKSRWRLEMVEPEQGGIKETKQYFDTVLRCYSLYLEAYLNSLERAVVVDDPEIIEKTKSEIKNFVSILYEHDIAVRMGKMIFPEQDFDSYFLDAFWGVGDI